MKRRVLLLLVWGLAVRAAIALWLPPGFDEAYYFAYTLHPSLSYFDHPPLVALSTGLGPWLTGEVSQLTIRLGALALHTFSLVLLYLTSRKLFSARVATLTLAIATGIPFFQVGFGVLTLPDAPLICFWSASLWLAAHEFFDPTAELLRRYRPSARLAGLGLLVGLACLSKYHGFLLGLGLVLFCALSSRHRVALRSPWSLLGLGLFLVALSPVLVWNGQHDWASFRFQGLRAVPDVAYNFQALLGVLLVEIGCLFPSFGLPLWWVSLHSMVALLSPPQARDQRVLRAASALREQQLLLLCVSLPVMVGFTLLGGTRPVLPSWPMPGFWGVTPLLGYQIVRGCKQAPRQLQVWLWGSGVGVCLIFTVVLLQVTAGFLQKDGKFAPFGGFLPLQTDASIQLVDVRQLRQGFLDSPALSTELEKADFVFTNRFFSSGYVAMALDPLIHKPITCFDVDPRGFAYWSRPEQWVGQQGLYITSNLYEPLLAASTPYSDYFASVTKVGSLPIRRGGATLQVFDIYRCENLRRPYRWPVGFPGAAAQGASL